MRRLGTPGPEHVDQQAADFRGSKWDQAGLSAPFFAWVLIATKN
ncbi:hypothetical protein JOD69_001035, partial [Methylocaldum sp. RMAD-M]|nr:hypothetical protein [Methylocaldum sp. RMAD-M]